ncbi:hypothetical protein BV25DRAFT_1921442 [Artomyces pyxidatus]|uniref:Uncharacterized protein n=1 Tax=Artomyces pyxidatus TaxID=48021 RepID=A0ACB8SIK2_9AGAM|nr:hypothetical protein BV25DRAFT_1921442 [Artomyces pyxidatus]
MSFILDQTGVQLVRDQWPNGYGRWPDDVLDQEMLDGWEIVPTNLEDIARKHTFVYFPGDDDPEMVGTEQQQRYQVTVRVQGFLGKHNLSVLGSWDGKEENACKASQFLFLEPGPFEYLFDAQRTALNSIQQYIFKRLSCPEHKQDLISPAPVYCSRRVFTKVAGMEDKPPSVLTSADDPLKRTRPLLPRWRVTEKVVFGRRISATEVRECDPIVFSVGDFVDVALTVDVAMHNGRTPGDPSVTAIHFDFKHVMQLCPAASVATMMLPHDPGNPQQSRAAKMMNAAINFYGKFDDREVV